MAFRSVQTTASIARNFVPARQVPIALARTFATTRTNMGVKVISSKADFDELIKSDKPTIIDFWATWCGPCKMISPIFEKIAEATGDSATFAKVDVDEQGEIAQEVGIRAMPTFLVFKNGQQVDKLLGADPSKLQSIITNAVSA